jgi:hypothetical protein
MLASMRLAAMLFALITSACTDREADQLADVKSKVCACPTSKCAELAMDALPKQSVASNHRTQETARRMLDCLAKLYDREKPVANPDEEASDPGSAAPASARTP